MYNNQLISVTGAEDRGTFQTVLGLFGATKLVGCAVEERCHNTRLILFKFVPKGFPGYSNLLYPMGLEQTALFAWNWLAVVSYPPEPDFHDGDNVKGWRVYNEDWTHVAGRWEAAFAVEPMWMMAGK
jgi:hypothetical protein